MLLLVIALFACMAFAAVEQNATNIGKQAFTITQKQADRISLHFSLPEFEVEEVNEADQVFHRIIIPNSGSTLDAGLPELPNITISLAIPKKGTPQLSVSGLQNSQLQSFRAYPQQLEKADEGPKSLVYDADFYSSNTNYPQAVVEYGDPYILRDFRLINIQVNPFSYNPYTQELTIYQDLDLEIDFSNEPGINEMEGDYSTYSPVFEKIYEASIFNFDDYRYQMFSNYPPRYLIIHGQTTDQNFHNALDEYVLWKRQKGADVDVASTATNQAGNSTTTIKNYIQAAYNNPVTRPDYVILIGDTTGSYPIPAFTSPSGVGDYAYTHLEGNDLVGDCFIGRISVENLAQFQTVLSKIYLYERDINIATAGWLNRMLLVADWSPSGISTVYISRYIKEAALKLNPDYTFTELYGSDPSSSSMNTAINQGIGFFSFRGWIGMNGWSPSESLNNAYRLCHAIIPTCGTGNFNSLATTESFIRLGSAAQPKGAVTATGMATSSTNTVFNNSLHGGMWGGMLHYGMRTMGEALLNAKVFTHQIYGASATSLVTNHCHWFNLMGDPTMEVFFGIPQTFNVMVQDTIPLGLKLLDVSIMDEDMAYLEGASVTLSQGSSILSRGYTDSEGSLILQLPSSMGAGDCVLTVSMHNYKPLQTTINVDTSGTLIADNIIIVDDNTGQSQGNADGVANGGETLELLFSLKNTTDGTLAGITGHLTSTSPYVTIIDSLVSYNPIFAGEVGFNPTPAVIYVHPDTPHEYMLRFNLLLTDTGGNSYDISEYFPVANAKIRYHSYILENAGNNNALNPGESAGLIVTLSNIGAVGVTDVYARLYTMNDLVSVMEHTVYYGDMLQNIQVLPQNANFVLYARPQSLPGMTIPMQIKLYNDDGFEQWVDFTFTIGHVTVNDPLGPCSYGYVIYDDQDYGYPECPTYNWVGIAPAEGGSGTALAISDGYASNDEGDQVGATSTAIVDLPFPFQFYGLIYNQITVCSNGFIAMGESENGEFRNYRLPGPMGPSPMIAPFWDDLATHSGSGIYTWFDRGNHAFVIEWYNMRNGSNGSSPETFQVILYDPAIHAGSLGDGPIKIQYHTFNNVDATSAGTKHGRYATIGIKDHTGTVGLEYSYANVYPTAASPLGNSRALYITNIPIHYEEAHLVVGETYVNDPNGNGVCEPGETVELGILINNIGNMTALEPVATISTNSTYVTMINNESVYFPIEGDNNGVNRTPFVFTIAPNCPDETVINFGLEIISDEDVWERSFSLKVNASNLEYLGFLIDDSDENYDGVIDPGESINLVLNVRNHAEVAAQNIMATLSCGDPDIVIADPIIFKDTINPDDVMQFGFNINYIGTNTENHYKSFQFNVSAENGMPASATIAVPFNMNNIFSDFETENGGFVSETGWAWGTPTQVTPFSGMKLWASNLTGNYPDLVTYNLYTPEYSLETGSQMSFRHRYGFETNYDGGNVSMSVNGGETWSVIQPVGGYPSNSLAGLTYQPGYSGTTNNWIEAKFNLSAWANHRVMFKFCLGSDGSVNNIGWFIDNFEITNVAQKVGYVHGSVVPISDFPVQEAVVQANNSYATNPDEDGAFKLFLPYGTYSVTASLPHHQPSSIHGINIMPATPNYYTEYTLINLPRPHDIHFTVDNDIGLVGLTWELPIDPVLDIASYRVYKRFNTGPFEMVQETTSMDYTDMISLEGEYQYYVVAKYLHTEGQPSNMVSFTFPYETSTDDVNSPAMVTKLNNNYPNPFNPSTTISFDLAKAGNVKLSIYNIKGQLVRRLHNAPLASGNHKIVWNGRDESNRPVASGIYYYKLDTGGYRKTNKMLLMK